MSDWQTPCNRYVSSNDYDNSPHLAHHNLLATVAASSMLLLAGMLLACMLLAGCTGAETDALLSAQPSAVSGAEPGAIQHQVTTEVTTEAVTDKAIGCNTNTELVLLGTAGGPMWWPQAAPPVRSGGGVSSALVVGDSVYVVDVGDGAWLKYRKAGLGRLGPNEGLENLRGIFITHMHDDHVVDLASLVTLGLSNGLTVDNVTHLPISIFGPSDREGLSSPVLIEPEHPLPGITETTDSLIAAYRNLINTRILAGPIIGPVNDPRTMINVQDIALPDGLVSDPDTNPSPAMDPILIYEDENVAVSAVLVNHPFPSFAYRFDTADGSVVFSGDTGPNTNGNMVRLAAGADILVHEVFHEAIFEQMFGPPPFPEQAQQFIDTFFIGHTHTDVVGDIAADAGVDTLVLNHLVPADLPDVAYFVPAAQSFAGEVIVGRDLMRICVGG